MVVHSRQELIDEAMKLWKQHGSDYRSLLGDYEKLLNQKRDMIKTGRMRKTRLEPIKKSDLKEYPKIRFLDYNDESDARHYLTLLDSKEIAYIIKRIEDEFANSALTQTLKARIYDYDYQIRHCDDRRSIYALNPESCKSSGKHSHRRQLSYTANLNVSEK